MGGNGCDICPGQCGGGEASGGGGAGGGGGGVFWVGQCLRLHASLAPVPGATGGISPRHPAAGGCGDGGEVGGGGELGYRERERARAGEASKGAAERARAHTIQSIKIDKTIV